jgi:hypothetical protein
VFTPHISTLFTNIVIPSLLIFFYFLVLPQFHYYLNNIVLFFSHKTTKKVKNKKCPWLTREKQKNEAATLLYFQFPLPLTPSLKGRGEWWSILPQEERGTVNPPPSRGGGWGEGHFS